MVLVGPSLGAAVAIDFAMNHPEAVSISILIIHLISMFSELLKEILISTFIQLLLLL